MSDRITEQLAHWNKDTGTSESGGEEDGWLNPITGRLVDEEYYYSDHWYGIEGFGTFDSPGPDWVHVIRSVETRTVTSAWTAVGDK